ANVKVLNLNIPWFRYEPIARFDRIRSKFYLFCFYLGLRWLAFPGFYFGLGAKDTEAKAWSFAGICASLIVLIEAGIRLFLAVKDLHRRWRDRVEGVEVEFQGAY